MTLVSQLCLLKQLWTTISKTTIFLCIVDKSYKYIAIPHHFKIQIFYKLCAKPSIFQTKTFSQNENLTINKKVMGLENGVVLGENGYGNFTLAKAPK